MKLAAMNESTALYSFEGEEYPYNPQKALEQLLAISSWKDMLSFAKTHACNSAYTSFLLDMNPKNSTGVDLEHFCLSFLFESDTPYRVRTGPETLPMDLPSLIDRDNQSRNDNAIEYIDEQWARRFAKTSGAVAYYYLDIGRLLEYKREIEQLILLATIALGGPIPNWMLSCYSTRFEEGKSARFLYLDEEIKALMEYQDYFPFMEHGIFGNLESAYRYIDSASVENPNIIPRALIHKESEANQARDVASYSKYRSAIIVLYCLNVGVDDDYDRIRTSTEKNEQSSDAKYSFSSEDGFFTRDPNSSFGRIGTIDMYKIVKAAILENRVTVCHECGKPILYDRKSKKYCSNSCRTLALVAKRNKAHALGAAGTSFEKVLEIVGSDNPETVHRWYEDGKKLGAQASGKTDGR